MRTLTQSVLTLIFSSSLFTLAACELPVVENTSSGIQVGKLKAITKSEGRASYNIAHAMVGVNKVIVRSVSGQFITVNEDSMTLDLVTLNGNFSVLFRARIPEGDYDHIRLVTSGDGVALLDNGAEVPLTIPSGEQSGIKIFFSRPLHVTFGQLVKVYLVIDLSRSFHAAGNNMDRIQMKPVIRAHVIVLEDHNPSDGTEVPGDLISNDDNAGSSNPSDEIDEGTSDDSNGGTQEPVDDGWYPVLGI